MPSASVSTTVIVRPLALASERNAYLKSLMTPPSLAPSSSSRTAPRVFDTRHQKNLRAPTRASSAGMCAVVRLHPGAPMYYVSRRTGRGYVGAEFSAELRLGVPPNRTAIL